MFRQRVFHALQRLPWIGRGFDRFAYPAYFNTAVRFKGGDWFVNERMVEIPFVQRAVPGDGRGKTLLDFGCTMSELAMQFASVGYQVTGVDLRPYPFQHPQLTTLQANLLEAAIGPFDYITAVSVLEHVGLAAYGEAEGDADLERVVRRLHELLVPGGKLVLTVPCGRPHRDHFLRSFSPEALRALFTPLGMRPVQERFYQRRESRFWLECDATEVAEVSNVRQDCGPTGVNGVGCFVWERG